MSSKHYCTHCQKHGHKDNKCWKLHPEKVPDYLRRDKGQHLKNARKLRQTGAAYQYDPTKIGFLDLPFEVRSVILKDCLSNDKVRASYPFEIYALNNNEYDIGIQFSHPRRRKTAESSSLSRRLDMDWPRHMWIERRYAAVAGFNIMLTCRALANEGMSVLYEQNHYVTLQPLRFLVRFSAVVRAKFQQLRYLTMGLPSELKLTTTHLPKFLDLVCDGMLNLRYLCLTSEYPHLGKPLVVDWEETYREFQEERALLHTAAWVTLRHPNLCEAVWSYERERTPQMGDEDEHDIKNIEEGEPQILEIKIISSMYKRKAYDDLFVGIEHTWKGPPYDPDLDTVLDTRKIRFAGWDGVLTMDFRGKEDLDEETTESDLDTNVVEWEQQQFLSDKKRRQLGLPIAAKNGGSGRVVGA